MEFLDKERAIHKMNLLSEKREPFMFLINFDQSESVVQPLTEINTEVLNYKLGTHSNEQKNKPKSPHFFNKTPVSFNEFKSSFEKVRKNINYGNSFLTNLTFETPIETDLSLKQIFENTNAKYKVWLNDKFCCFSPETFVKIKGDKIFSYPMKGTIDADQYEAEKVLLNDHKEIAEHVTIVDLIRNDLSIVADEVKVPKFRFVEKLKTNQKDLLQVSSEITGVLKSPFKNRTGDLIFSLLPAGSISGAPKKQTVEIISSSETHERGFYTGICGVYDGKDLNSGVMIRFIEERNKKLYFKSGGGITHFSNAEKEYNEYIDKVYLPL